MLYKDFKESIRSLGFRSIEDFMQYAGVTSDDVLSWEEKNEIPYLVSLILHILKGEKELLVTNSALDNVIAYIANQKEHHKKQSFKEEYKEFLNKFQIEHKDEYLFEWIE
mgnify:CR=1 FL=1